MRTLLLGILVALPTLSVGTWSPATRAEHGSPLLLVKPGDGSTIPRNAQIRLVSYNGEDRNGQPEYRAEPRRRCIHGTTSFATGYARHAAQRGQ